MGTQTIFSILLIKQTKIISLRTLIIKQTKKIFPSMINYFLLPIIGKLIIFGWGGEKLHVKGWGRAKSESESFCKSESEAALKFKPESTCKKWPSNGHSTLLTAFGGH